MFLLSLSFVIYLSRLKNLNNLALYYISEENLKNQVLSQQLPD